MVRIALLGVAVGVISGLVGAGGGFLLVPALALLAGLPMPAAVGTSLVVISMQSFAGFAGHLATEHIDWRLAGLVTAAAVLGALIGGRLIAFVDPNTLRKLFGWFVLLMASVMLAEEVHPAVGAAAAGLTLIAAGMSIACTRYAHCPLRRSLGRSSRRAAADRPIPPRGTIKGKHDIKGHTMVGDEDSTAAVLNRLRRAQGPTRRRDLDDRAGPRLQGRGHPARRGLARAGPGRLQDRRHRTARMRQRRRRRRCAQPMTEAELEKLFLALA